MQKTRGYFILVTAETGLELYDPLNVTDKTITAKIPSRTHTRVMREHNKIKSTKMIYMIYNTNRKTKKTYKYEIRSRKMRSARAAEFATSVLSIELIAPNHCKLIPAFSSLHFGCIFFIIAFWVHFLVFFSDC